MTNVNDDGPGSLRQAITDANNSPGTDTIAFNLGGAVRTIRPVRSLPSITDPAVFDGTTQPDFAGTPVVELRGSGIAPYALAISAPGTVVRGLVINGFGHGGISIGSAGGGSRVEGCYIGTDVTGTVAVPNNGAGISIYGSNNVIGGTTPAARNVISGNNGPGVQIEVFCCTGTIPSASGNVVRGNYIGVNAAGNAALPNTREGVIITTASSEGTVADNIVGGAEPGAGNVISGNGFDGLVLGSFQTTGAVVKGNIIGADATGTFAVPNGGDGIRIELARNNVIGGSEVGARNVVSGNGINGGSTGRGNGITVGGSGNVVRGNVVGVNAAGVAPLPNFLFGVAAGGSNQTIGGVGAGEGNVIAFSGFDGIVCGGAAGTGNSFRGNSIFSNGIFDTHPDQATIGIDLGNFSVTPNDAGDADSGPNNLQNFPVITSVTNGAGGLNVKGTLNSTPGAAFALDFYANSVCDPLGHGEGARYIGSAGVTTNGGGDAAFDVTFNASLPPNQIVTATATDPAGNTSEFSQCSQSSSAAGSVGFENTFVTVSEAGGTASFNVTRAGGAAGPLTIGYTVTGVTAAAGSDFTPTQGTLTFADGETSKVFTLPVLNDNLDESFSETAKVTLSTAGHLDTLGTKSIATLTINDDDPLPEVSIGDVSAAEGNAGTTDFNFPVTLSAVSGRDVTVTYATAGGTAAAGSDYVSADGSAVIPAGRTAGVITVKVVGDLAIEPDETFTLSLTNATGGSITDNAGLGTIRNDDVTSVQFPANAATVSEAAGSVQLTVNRVGDFSGSFTVFYSTSDGTASERSDYTAAVGALHFAPGEGSKTVTVFITDDALVEGDETFSVSLSGQNGAPTNQPSSVTVTVKSDDTAAGPNPVDASEFFVRQHYRDFLGRDADAPGLTHWTNEIEQCGADAQCREVKRINVSAAFFLSIEFQETGYLVYKTYGAAHGTRRVGGAVPLTLHEFLSDTQAIGADVVVNQGDWQTRLEANKLAYFNEFVSRPAFTALYPESLTAAQFVDAMNTNVGGALTPDERESLVTRLVAGQVNRAQALREVAENAAFSAREKNRAFVLMQYFGYLRRAPDAAPDTDFSGYNFWLGKLNEFNGNFIQAEMVKAFLSSIEYRRRFGQ